MADFFSPAISGSTTSEENGYKAPAFSSGSSIEVTTVDMSDVWDGTPVAGDVMRIVRLPSSARVVNIEVSESAGAGAAAVSNIGVYETPANGGAVIDVDCIAAGFVQTGLLTGGINAVTGIAGQVQGDRPLWELAGLSSDPGGDFDIAFTPLGDYDNDTTKSAVRVDFIPNR